jgi:hypothetical protein
MRQLCFVCTLLVASASAWGQTGPEETLRGIEKRYLQEQLPRPLRPPVSAEEADAFAAAVKFYRESATKDVARIAAVEAGDDRSLKSDKERLNHWVGNEVPRLLQEVLQQTRNILQSQVMSATESVQFGADIDMADKDMVRNNLANPDNITIREEAVRDGLRSIDVLIRIDEQLGEKSEWPAKRKEFEGFAAKFHEKLAAAAAMIVPPKDIGDAELRGIAEATLKDSAYGVKAWKRLVVNSPKQHKQFSVYEIRDTMIVRCDYDFDYFQATTIESEGSELFLFHNTLAYYANGAPTTPLNKWVLRERYRGARIVPENVDK